MLPIKYLNSIGGIKGRKASLATLVAEEEEKKKKEKEEKKADIIVPL